MDFVEDHRRDPVQPRIGLQPAEQQALGDDLDAGFRRSGAVEAGSVADGAPDRLTKQECHPRGRCSGREPPRFQHQDPAVASPGGIEQRERDKRRLAGAGRRDNNGVAAGGQGGLQRGDCVSDWKL